MISTLFWGFYLKIESVCMSILIYAIYIYTYVHRHLLILVDDQSTFQPNNELKNNLEDVYSITQSILLAGENGRIGPC